MWIYYSQGRMTASKGKLNKVIFKPKNTYSETD